METQLILQYRCSLVNFIRKLNSFNLDICFQLLSVDHFVKLCHFGVSIVIIIIYPSLSCTYPVGAQFDQLFIITYII